MALSHRWNRKKTLLANTQQAEVGGFLSISFGVDASSIDSASSFCRHSTIGYMSPMEFEMQAGLA
jgi:hypothetical protein